MGMTKLLARDGEGERLDRYELIAELASGGMATVYLARNTGVAGFQRLVAIKRLHPHLAREPEFIEMFLDEARLAARIHHPNVVPIQEVGQSDTGYYLVMDYVEGDTFARLLARGAQSKQRIPYAVTVRVMLDTLAGLHAAHEMTDDAGQPLSIVHRDVSPQNILVGVDGIARITDFGVARAASRLSTTRSGQLKGKLAYMAPEQARGGGIDRRADLFSCGIVLWEALALKRLFKGEGEAETLNRVLYEPIPPPSSVRKEVPPALDEICMRALERDVDKRYSTAMELAEHLEKAAQAALAMGSVRDVASCLEAVVGTDLTKQRDEVRAWLTRSEPSNPTRGPYGSIPPPPVSSHSNPRYLDSSKTRIEGSTREPSRPQGPPVDRSALTAPEKVSSVSSAVLQVSADPTGPSEIAAARTRSRRRLYIAVTAAAVIAGGVGFGASRIAGKLTPATPPPPAATTVAAPTPTPAPIPSAEPAKPAAEPKPVVSAAPAVPASASASPTTPAKKPAARPVSARPNPAPTGAGAPDDLSRNPYR
jgi:eukaryotic-like serine/threonine-protein kinase